MKMDEETIFELQLLPILTPEIYILSVLKTEKNLGASERSFLFYLLYQTYLSRHVNFRVKLQPR